MTQFNQRSGFASSRSGRPTPPLDPDDASAARETAMRIVTGAAQSSAGLKRRLEQRGYTPEAADEAVAAMGEYGYVDDAALAASIVGRRQRQGYGHNRVAAALRARGIDGEVIDSAVQAVDADAELERAIEAARKWRRGHPGDLDRAALGRLGAGLQRRGFGTSVIRAAIEAARTEE